MSISASRTDPRGVLISQGQAADTYDPAALEFGQTYYWRVDEVDAAPDPPPFKGAVWSFTVEPYAYPLRNITATASSAQAGMGPENTINGSGLDAADQHSIDLKQMWLSAGAQPNWIQYRVRSRPASCTSCGSGTPTRRSRPSSASARRMSRSSIRSTAAPGRRWPACPSSPERQAGPPMPTIRPSPSAASSPST